MYGSPRKPLTSPSFLTEGNFLVRCTKKKQGLSKVLGFILGYHLKIAVRQLFGGGEMIQDAQNPM